MAGSTLLIVSGIFLLAGLVKGMAACVVIPNALTNIWQMIAGPAFAAPARRLALLLIAVALGTFTSIGLPAVAGMVIGLRIRHRLDPVLFRRWFLVGLLLLGGYTLLR
jgi:uncharacterized membrane protein YfcA